jgi:4-amino-4-deoxy-L-arabinose transferase-like glycosyltransferase
MARVKLRGWLCLGALLMAAAFRLWGIAELPPGLNSDEAFHLLQAQQIDRGGYFPVYITGNDGNEPLMAYSAALMLLILGPVTWAGRLAMAFIGLLGVAATIRAGQEMFPRTAVGGLAGAALGALFWNIDFSRFGSQPILVATAAAGCLAALWHGARTGRRRSFVLAGVCLGLGLDSYVAFRLFPLVVVIALAALLLAAAPAQRRALLAGGALLVVSAGVVFAPLAIFFIQNPDWFFHRFSQTTAGTLNSGSTETDLAANTIKTLLGLVVSGDQNWRHNIGGRPALDAAQIGFSLAGGAAVALRRHWALGVTLLAWLVIGLTPSVITTESPHFGRTTMVTPAFALLIGLGVWAAWRFTSHWRVGQALVAAAALLSVALTAWSYFGVWAHDFNLFQAFSMEQIGTTDALLAAPPGARWIVPDIPIARFTIEYLMGEANYQRVQSYASPHCQVLLDTASQPAAYALITPAEFALLPDLQRAYPAGTWTVTDHYLGRPTSGLFLAPQGTPALTPTVTARNADFGGNVLLQGYGLSDETLRPGATLTLTLLWKIEQPTGAPLKRFTHLLGAPKADGNIVYAQNDSQPCDGSYATTVWEPGDQLVTTETLALPGDLPAGAYTLQTGWYDPDSGARLPVSNDTGSHKDDAVQLQDLKTDN